jgi:hypothetical protein
LAGSTVSNNGSIGGGGNTTVSGGNISNSGNVSGGTTSVNGTGTVANTGNLTGSNGTSLTGRTVTSVSRTGTVAKTGNNVSAISMTASKLADAVGGDETTRAQAVEMFSAVQGALQGGTERSSNSKTAENVGADNAAGSSGTKLRNLEPAGSSDGKIFKPISQSTKPAVVVSQSSLEMPTDSEEDAELAK